MKYLALLLFFATVAQIYARGVYPNGCPKDWTVRKLIPHPNCNKFYLCWNGRRLVQSCPPRFYFNIRRQRCEWQPVPDCRDLNNPDQNEGNYDPSKAPFICAKEGSDGVLVAHEKCNNYYICDHGTPVAQRCPANLYFNPKNDECDWPKNVNCKGRIIPGPIKDGNVGAGNSDPSKAPYICAAKNSSGVLVAHEICNNYYICVNGKPLAQRCPASLVFNPEKDECDWPKNVCCKDRVILGPIEDTHNDWDLSVNDDNSKIRNVGAGNSDPSKAPYICAAKNSSGVLVAHEKCNRYYICDHGKPVARRCPAHLLFNPKKDQCDWPRNVNCRRRVILSPREDTQKDWDLSVNGDNSKNGNVGAGNSDPSKAPYICAAKNSSGVLVAHEKCNRYYICDHGKPVARRCPAHLLFNPKKDQCDWPRNVNCRRRVILGPREDTQKDWDLSVNGDNSKNGNVGAGNSDPSKAPYICAAKNSSGVLIAHEKCHKYYICDHGKPVVRHCPANLFFNPKKDQCDWPENVDCRDKDTSGSSESNSEEDSSKEDSSEEDSSEEDSTENEIIRERFLKRLLRALREIIRRLLRN